MGKVYLSRLAPGLRSYFFFVNVKASVPDKHPHRSPGLKRKGEKKNLIVFEEVGNLFYKKRQIIADGKKNLIYNEKRKGKKKNVKIEGEGKGGYVCGACWDKMLELPVASF